MADIIYDHTTEHEFGKGVTYAAPIDLSAKKPLDARFYADTIADRDAHYTGNRCYPGMQVYVGTNGLTYLYNGEKEIPGEGGAESTIGPDWLVMADRTWVGEQIAEITGGAVTEARVIEIVNNILSSKQASGEMDDIREYSYGPRSLYTVAYDSSVQGEHIHLYYDESSSKTYVWKDVSGTEQYVEATASDYLKYFPVTGVSDIQYIDKYQNLEYRWDDTENKYMQTNEIVSKSDIDNLFN